MGSSSPKLASYLNEQLAYDHREENHPTNTQAMVHNQHRLIRKTIEHEARHQPIHLLDIGCGWGDLCGQLQHLVVDYVGVEPSLVELKRFTCNHNRWLIRGIGEHLPFLRSSSRNVILLNSVLDHCVDWRRAFDNCMRILAPDGILVISMENADKIPIRLFTALGRQVKHEGHVAFFSMREFVSLLLMSGLRVERQRSIGFLFGFHGLTKRIPVPEKILRVANEAADAFAGRIFRHGGHVMFVVARKVGENKACQLPENPFQCSMCGTPMHFGSRECPDCQRRYLYVDNAILDTTEDPEFRAVTETTSHH
jgi:SAM-dependent methyltransferase